MAQHVVIVVVVGLVVHVANVPVVEEANGLGVPLEVLVLPVVVRPTNRGEEPVEIAPAAVSLEEW